ncbi:hypothetical protein M8C21_029647, partial [Ambrosia artemisiifolia]
MQRALNWGGNDDQAFLNPTLLANHKRRQRAQFHSNPLDTTKYQDTSTLFEHFLIAGIHPNANVEPVEDAFAKRKKWESKADKADIRIMRFLSPPVVMMEPQILFKYPPGNSLPMRLADLASFCFPDGVKVMSMLPISYVKLEGGYGPV